MNKGEIRKIIIKKRKNIQNNYYNLSSFVIIKKIIRKFNLINKNIGIYFPINNEINILHLFNIAKINFYFPKINKNKMIFSHISNNLQTIINNSNKNQNNYIVNKNNYKQFNELILTNKIIQPKYKKYILIPEVIIVPMVAFNEKCFRIGYGGGYYDKYLKNKKILKIGVAFNFQKQKFHVEHYDIPLDYIVTETRFYRKPCKKLF